MRPPRKYLYNVPEFSRKQKQLQVMETQEFAECKIKSEYPTPFCKWKSSRCKIIMVMAFGTYINAAVKSRINSCRSPRARQNICRHNSIAQGAYDFNVESRTIKFLSLFKSKSNNNKSATMDTACSCAELNCRAWWRTVIVFITFCCQLDLKHIKHALLINLGMFLINNIKRNLKTSLLPSSDALKNLQNTIYDFIRK